MQSDRFKYLRAAVTLNRRDAHLGHHLDHSLDGGFDVIVAGIVWCDIDQQPLADHVVHRFEGEIRVDRPRAVTDQQREMMHFARLAGFQHQTDPRARAFPDQMMMQPGHGQQGGNGRHLLVHAAIGQNQNIGSRLDLPCGPRA